jgi:iron complex outermembrane receptor protein
MQFRLLLAFSATVSLLALSAEKPVIAQTNAQTSAAATGLEELVVTARRKEEKVQSVPIAITAFTQADVEKNHIEQVRDLAKVVPSFAVSFSTSDPNAFYSGQVRLRGLAGTEIYFAEVPLSNTDYSNTTGLTHGLSPGFFYDLEDVEVDKGAQGTLFGRPSIGGLISYQPRRPTNDFEGYVQTTFGDYDDYEEEFAVNIPVIEDKLMVRVAGQMQKRDGYTKDVQNGQYLDDRDYYAWRIGVTLRPTDDFENYLLYDGYWQDSNGGSNILTNLNPKFTLVPHISTTLNGISPGLANLFPASVTKLPLTTGNGPSLAGLFNPATVGATIGEALSAGGFAAIPGLGSVLAEQQALGPRAVLGRATSNIGKDYFYGFTDIATWDVTDNLTIKNIAAARIFKQLAVDDFSSTGLPILTIGYPGNNQEWNNNEVQYTDELQVSGKALNDRLDWRLGGFLLFDHPLGYNTEVSDAVGSPTWDHFREETRSQAVFAHGIYDLSDWIENLRFTAGYRYTWDYDSLGEQSTKPVDGVTRTGGIANNCNIAIHDNNCFTQVDSHFSSFGWNLGLDYQITPQTLVYVRAGNAYRPGGTNLAVPAPFNEFKPEHVTDVELGVKTDYDIWGVHGRTNADIYHTDYKAIQVSQVITIPSAVPGQPPSAQQIQTNAASAYLEGAEIQQNFSLPYGIDLSAQGSYIYTHYDSYPQVFGQVGSPPFNYIPLFQFSVTPTYHVPIDPSWGEMTASITWQWYGHQATSPLEKEILNVQPHYENFDFRADWTNIFGQPVDLGVFVTNLTDNLHIVGEIPLWTSLGFSSVAYNPPRMFGFTLKYRFEPNKEEAAPAAAYVPPPAVAPAPSVPHSYLVFFDFNKSDLTAQAVTIVDQAAANAGPAKVTQLTVTGHTDTVGSDAYNMRLSRRRAESVAAQLEKDGIASSEIQIVAKGKRDLLVPTADGVREPQNRRVQIVYDGGPTS